MASFGSFCVLTGSSESAFFPGWPTCVSWLLGLASTAVTLIFTEAAICSQKNGTWGVHAKTTVFPPVQELYSHLEHVGDVQALCSDVEQLVCHARVDAL